MRLACEEEKPGRRNTECQCQSCSTQNWKDISDKEKQRFTIFASSTSDRGGSALTACLAAVPSMHRKDQRRKTEEDVEWPSWRRDSRSCHSRRWAHRRPRWAMGGSGSLRGRVNWSRHRSPDENALQEKPCSGEGDWPPKEVCIGGRERRWRRIRSVSRMKSRDRTGAQGGCVSANSTNQRPAHGAVRRQRRSSPRNLKQCCHNAKRPIAPTFQFLIPDVDGPRSVLMPDTTATKLARKAIRVSYTASHDCCTAMMTSASPGAVSI